MDDKGRIILRAAIEEAEAALTHFAREDSEVLSSILTDVENLGATCEGKQEPLTGEANMAAQEALRQLIAYMGRAAGINTDLAVHITGILDGRNPFGRSLFGEGPAWVFWNLRKGWRIWRKPLATAQERTALKAAFSGWNERTFLVETLIARFGKATDAREAVLAVAAAGRTARESLQTFIADLKSIEAAAYPQQ